MSGSARLSVTQAAAQQIREAARWWHQNRPEAAEVFADELERAFVPLIRHPHIGPRARDLDLSDVRRLLLRQSRYHVYYVFRSEQSEVVVLALWHTSRGASAEL